MGDFEIFETTPFVPGWVDFPLMNGVRLDIMGSLKGVKESFDECLKIAPIQNRRYRGSHFTHKSSYSQ